MTSLADQLQNLPAERTVVSHYLGVDRRGHLVMLKMVLGRQRRTETLAWPSTCAIGLLGVLDDAAASGRLRDLTEARSVDQNSRVQIQTFLALQPTMVAADWDGTSLTGTVRDFQVIGFTNAVGMAVTLVSGATLTYAFPIQVGAYLRHYLRDARPDLIDLRSEPGPAN